MAFGFLIEQSFRYIFNFLLTHGVDLGLVETKNRYERHCVASYEFASFGVARRCNSLVHLEVLLLVHIFLVLDKEVLEL